MTVDFSRIDSHDLDLEFYTDVFHLLDKLPDLWVVTEGYRTMERSNILYIDYKLHGGVKAAPGGLSPHNYGLAIDVSLDGDPVKKGVQVVWNIKDKRWLRLANAVWKHPRLRSGKWFDDWPHIEKLKWKDYVAWGKNYEDNIRMLREQYPALRVA
jgi:peptidoglycan LD-endopeptidase CwlK